MICPIMSMRDGTFVECEGPNCALWSEEKEKCVIGSSIITKLKEEKNEN